MYPDSIIWNSLKEAIRKMGVKEDISINKKSCTKLLGYTEYKGHYRELENILSSAIMKAQLDHRNEICAKDLEEVMDIGKKFMERIGQACFQVTNLLWKKLS